jgi:cysteinyl-tRNA synthetase
MDFDRVLGIGFLPLLHGQASPKGISVIAVADLPSAAGGLVAEREEARREGDFRKADELREELKTQGYVVEDTKEGPVVRGLEETPGPEGVL